MAVTVGTPKDYLTYPDAQKWHVDENELLHLRGESGQIATYARGTWIYAAQGKPEYDD